MNECFIFYTFWSCVWKNSLKQALREFLKNQRMNTYYLSIFTQIIFVLGFGVLLKRKCVTRESIQCDLWKNHSDRFCELNQVIHWKDLTQKNDFFMNRISLQNIHDILLITYSFSIILFIYGLFYCCWKEIEAWRQLDLTCTAWLSLWDFCNALMWDTATASECMNRSIMWHCVTWESRVWLTAEILP